jgi:hypothetical protein
MHVETIYGTDLEKGVSFLWSDDSGEHEASIKSDAVVRGLAELDEGLSIVLRAEIPVRVSLGEFRKLMRHFKLDVVTVPLVSGSDPVNSSGAAALVVWA